MDETKSGHFYFSTATWNADKVASFQIGQETGHSSPLYQFVHKDGKLQQEIVAEEHQVTLYITAHLLPS